MIWNPEKPEKRRKVFLLFLSRQTMTSFKVACIYIYIYIWFKVPRNNTTTTSTNTTTLAVVVYTILTYAIRGTNRVRVNKTTKHMLLRDLNHHHHFYYFIYYVYIYIYISCIYIRVCRQQYYQKDFVYIHWTYKPHLSIGSSNLTSSHKDIFKLA